MEMVVFTAAHQDNRIIIIIKTRNVSNLTLIKIGEQEAMLKSQNMVVDANTEA